MSRRSEEAARAWLEAAGYTKGRAAGVMSKPPAVRLAEAAFAAYEDEWGAREYDVRAWAWPFEALKDPKSVQGDEVWTVLFKHALGIILQDAECRRVVRSIQDGSRVVKPKKEMSS